MPRTPTERFTKTLVDSLQPGEKAYTVWDRDMPGFGIRVWTSGTKVFAFKYTKRAEQHWITLGRYGVITVDQARKKAQKIRLQILEGEDPHKKLTEQRDAPTVNELANRFLEEHVETKTKATTQRQYREAIARFIVPELGKRLVRDLEPGDIAKLHHSIRATPYQANRVLAVMSKMLKMAELWGYRPQASNPCFYIQKFKEHSRERFLSAAELRRLAEVLTTMEKTKEQSLFAIAAIRLLMFTGARLNEILRLQWDEVDLESGVLRLKDSKTGAKAVFLNKPAVAVVETLPQMLNNPYVIAGDKEGTNLVNLEKPWDAIREKAKILGVRIHDLRHTFASYAAQGGMSLEMIGALLGHSQASTTKRYAHLANSQHRSNSERVALALETALKSEPEGRE
ncbi:site-specific integrase [Geothrix sp. 21YS21S-4]|uniref:tyrosine-type recombinase/integrase n=1 Tax=Geothrix sp. 21YS21S-4 TaxID=3068889 RepID=UPI0027B92275|nr:site-specific integrase [Geothrix sp. 21YS21S-4]